MQRRVVYRVTTIVTAMGLLLLGSTAHATEHLYEAMGMAKLPGTHATDFTLPTFEGTPVSLQTYRGKVVFLNFWATWCIPCREEMPALEQLHQAFQPQGLVILAINLKESPEQVKAFVDKHHLSFQVLLDHDGAIFRDYAVMGLPTTYLVSREGTLLARGMGGKDWTRAEGKDLIRELLARGPGNPGEDKGLTGETDSDLCTCRLLRNTSRPGSSFEGRFALRCSSVRQLKAAGSDDDDRMRYDASWRSCHDERWRDRPQWGHDDWRGNQSRWHGKKGTHRRTEAEAEEHMAAWPHEKPMHWCPETKDGMAAWGEKRMH